MKQHTFSLLRPAPLALLSFGAGIAVTFLMAGIPISWSADVANWASAGATTAAVVVALYVGVAPHRENRASYVRRARAVGMVVYGRFMRQEMHLEAARRLCESAEMSDFLFDLVRENLVSDPKCADVLIPYFDALPDEVASAVAAAIADLEAAGPLLWSHEGIGRGIIQAQRIGRVLDPLTKSLRRARAELSPFARGQKATDLDASIQNLVDGMVRLAEESCRRPRPTA